MRWPTIFSAHSDVLPTVLQRLRRRLARQRRAMQRYSFVAALCTAVAGYATSVTPPSFSELVTEAQTIARGTVRSVESRWVETPRGRVIKTFVSFAVEKPLKGNPGDTVTLEFLGGSVGTDTLHVAGMPEFKVGEQEILFVQGNGVQFCPLVRFGHGRYHVHSDAKTHRRFVTRNDESPLRSTADVQEPAEDHHPGAASATTAPDTTTALTPEAFETEIDHEVSRTATQR
jgi:hypothetical protein